MIKRLKWDVFHGGGGGEESDGGLSSSDDSDAGGSEAVLALMSELIANDPVLRARRPAGMVEFESEQPVCDFASGEGKKSGERKTTNRKRRRSETLGNSSIEEDDGRRSPSDSDSRKPDSSDEYEGDNEGGDPDDLYGTPNRKGEMGLEEKRLEEAKCEPGNPDDACNSDDACEKEREEAVATWRECELCPGKRFLNDREVDDHVSSKRHARALRKHEKRLKALEAGELGAPNETSECQATGTGPSVPKQTSSPESNQKSAKGNDMGEKMRIKKKARCISGEKSKGLRGIDPAAGISQSPSEQKQGVGGDLNADQRALKRKAAVKRKLKMKKERKWQRLHEKGADLAVGKG